MHMLRLAGTKDVDMRPPEVIIVWGNCMDFSIRLQMIVFLSGLFTAISRAFEHAHGKLRVTASLQVCKRTSLTRTAVVTCTAAADSPS